MNAGVRKTTVRCNFGKLKATRAFERKLYIYFQYVSVVRVIMMCFWMDFSAKEAIAFTSLVPTLGCLFLIVIITNHDDTLFSCIVTE